MLTDKFNIMVSVIVVNFNGEKVLENCLNSVLKTNYCSFEVIVVDNCSTDGSVKILRRFSTNPRVRVVFLSQNVHFAGGNNVGIGHSRGKYIVFLNNDTIVDRNWLSELIKTFEGDEKVYAAQCLLLKAQGQGIDSIGETVDYCGRITPASYLWARNNEAKKERRIFYGCGAALAVRRSVLQEVGCFDPETPTDEVDLCWRINLAGGKIVLVPKSIVYHYRSASFGRGLNKERLFFGELARLFCVLKNYELRSLVKVSPYMIAYLIITCGFDLFIRRRIDILVFRLKAYIYVLKNLKRLFVKRLRVQKYIRKISDVELKKLMVKPNPYYYLITSLTT